MTTETHKYAPIIPARPSSNHADVASSHSSWFSGLLFACSSDEGVFSSFISLERSALLAFVTSSALFSHFISVYLLYAHTPSLFVIGCGLLYIIYKVLDKCMLQYSATYAATSDQNKRFYVLTNIIKAILLCAMTPMAFMLLYDTLVLDKWDTLRIRNLGSLYVIPDLISLFLVKNMRYTTILHHIATSVVFNGFNMRNDYTSENICRLIMVYGIFSSFAYLVNLLLASRFLNVKQSLQTMMVRVAMIIYGSCCTINWCWQVYYTCRLFHVNHHWTIYMYICILMAVVWDDLILLRWLCYKCLHPPKHPSSSSTLCSSCTADATRPASRTVSHYTA